MTEGQKARQKRNEEIVKAVSEGISVKEVAEKYSLGIERIYGIFRQFSDQSLPTKEVHNKKDARNRELVQMYNSKKFTLKEICKKFNVSRQRIFQILKEYKNEN